MVRDITKECLSFNALPKYRDNVYDPDPGKSYTKAKLQKHTEMGVDKENRAHSASVSSSTAKQLELLFPTDEKANEIQVSLQSAQELHAKTIGQANNNLWYKERKYRITASTFGKIMKRKSPPTPAFVRAICNPRDISNLPFVKYGRENEGRVADLYVKKMHEEGTLD
ncbi:hypothetical protein OS493_035608 [Desmophyllum pertusum]|uniref:Uncharacterized protein n=1 Tax=Desmophyllum pertusum TaxID=174260 RepID=A0A9X0D0L0_9CNID|nr:hypothetical protein OS493_035608 [Desmophyllum pertusum]